MKKIEKLQSARSITSILLFIMATCLYHCGGPLRPSGTQSESDADSQEWSGPALLLQLDISGIHTIVANSTSLRIRVFSLVDDALAAQEGADQVFELSSSGDFRVKILTVGKKELQFAILDAGQKTLGTAILRMTVQPGVQRVAAPVTIRIPRTEEPVPVSFTINVTVNSSDSSRAISYVDVEPTFKGSCATAGCHDAATKAADINLSAFPFKSESYQDSQTDIVDVSLERMNNAASPMPPKRLGGQLDPKIIQLVKRWFDGGLKDKAEASDPANQIKGLTICWKESGGSSNICSDVSRTGTSLAFAKSVAGFRVGKTYDFVVTIVGPDGVKLFEKSYPGVTLPDSLAMTWQIDAEIKAPEVTIPVVVIQE